jgi:hypothetical protein
VTARDGPWMLSREELHSIAKSLLECEGYWSSTMLLDSTASSVRSR